MAVQHYPKILAVFLALSLAHVELAIGADTRELIATLQEAGFHSTEIQQIVSRVNRSYPESYVKDHIQWLKSQGISGMEQLTRALPLALPRPIQGDLEDKVIWLKSQGIKDIGKILSSYPQALVLSPKNDKLELKLAEFRDHWGITVAEIEKLPALLSADLQRVQRIRSLLDGIAKLAGDSHFDLKSLSIDQRQVLVQNGSAQQIFDSLKEVKAIDRKRESLSKLNTAERKTVTGLYHAHQLNDLLSFKHHEVASHVRDLKKPIPSQTENLEAFLKQEGFAYIERQQILAEKAVRPSAYLIGNIKDSIQWLNQQGVKDSAALTKALLVVPRYKIDKDLGPTVTWLKSEKIKDIGKILGSYPQILAFPIEGDLKPKLQWLKAVGIKDIPKLIQDSPQILTLSLEENLKPTFQWLEHQGVTDVAKLLTAYPQVFGLSVKDNLGPKIDWLKKLRVDIGKLTKYHPAALTYSLKDNLKPTALWLEQHGAEDVGRLINSFPAVLGYSIQKNLEPKLNWLSDQKFKEPGKLISSFPAIFSYSIEDNLTPKLAELKNHWGIGVAELENAPMLMGASLPRVQGVRLFLDDLAKLAGDSHFDLKSLPSQQSRVLIMTLSADQIFDRLKEVGAISAERKTLAELTAHERSVVAGLYREHALFYKLFAPGKAISSLSNRRISCFIDFLRASLTAH